MTGSKHDRKVFSRRQPDSQSSEQISLRKAERLMKRLRWAREGPFTSRVAVRSHDKVK